MYHYARRHHITLYNPPRGPNSPPSSDLVIPAAAFGEPGLRKSGWFQDLAKSSPGMTIPGVYLVNTGAARATIAFVSMPGGSMPNAPSPPARRDAQKPSAIADGECRMSKEACSAMT